MTNEALLQSEKEYIMKYSKEENWLTDAELSERLCRPKLIIHKFRQLKNLCSYKYDNWKPEKTQYETLKRTLDDIQFMLSKEGTKHLSTFQKAELGMALMKIESEKTKTSIPNPKNVIYRWGKHILHFVEKHQSWSHVHGRNITCPICGKRGSVQKRENGTLRVAHYNGFKLNPNYPAKAKYKYTNKIKWCYIGKKLPSKG